jgi:hypothetical protein
LRSAEKCEEACESDSETHSGSEQLEDINRVKGLVSWIAGQGEKPEHSNKKRSKNRSSNELAPIRHLAPPDASRMLQRGSKDSQAGQKQSVSQAKKLRTN